MGSQEIASTRFVGDANLVAYYRLESGALTTDSSAGGHTLTNTNTVGEGTGKFGVCADFSATNSNKDLRVTSDLGITGGAISISAWVKITTAPTSTNIACIAAQSDTGTNTEYYIRYYNNSGTLQLEFFRGKRGVGDNRVTVNHTLSTTAFTHVVLTYDATNIVGYINGVNVGTTAASGNGSSGSSDCFSIGEILGFNTWYLSGLVDDVAVFNRALTSDEITSLYKTGVKKLNGVVNLNPELESSSLRGDANLQGYWRLEDVNDETANNNDLTNNGTVTFVAGKFNNGANLVAASSQYLSITDANQTGLDFSTIYTLGFWVKLASSPTDGNVMYFVSKEASPNNSYSFFYRNISGVYYIDIRSWNSTNYDQYRFTQTLTPGEWYFITATCNTGNASATTFELFINGVSKGNGTGIITNNIATITNTAAPFVFGAYSNGTSLLNGMLDDAFAFDRVLTSTEISNLYNTNIKKYMGVSNV